MKFLEKGEEKVAKICEALRRETLEPAQKEAHQILAEANEQRDRILKEAEAESKKIIARARAQVEQEEALFQTSLTQAAKQAIELFKQQIEQALFNPALTQLVEEGTQDPKIIAKLINGIVNALERDGLAADITATIAETVSADEVNRLLAKEALERLKQKTVVVGDFAGGARIKLQAKRMTIDLSDEALRELLATYLRENYRTYLFGSP